MSNTEKIGEALIAAGQVLLDDVRRRRHRERQRLGKDWQQWPTWAQLELLAYLRSLDVKKPITN